jgi:hypothetical protein
MDGLILAPTLRLQPIDRFIDLLNDDTLDTVGDGLMLFQPIAHGLALPLFRIPVSRHEKTSQRTSLIASTRARAPSTAA